MEDLPIQKVAISGPTLASIMQRISSSLGDVDGLLFGHVTYITPSTLSDDSSSSSDTGFSHLIATVTSFLCPNYPLSFYDSLGRVDSSSLLRFLPSQTPHNNNHFIGWFNCRRKTPLRPSMREFSVSRSLSSVTNSRFFFPVKDSETHGNLIKKLPPSIFLLFSTPVQDQLIHTHEYRSYQFRAKTLSFDPKPVDIVNIGPAFRAHYGNFSPNNSGFPMLNCETNGLSAMNEDRSEVRLSEMKQVGKDQKELDLYAEDFEIKKLSRLIGPEASNYTLGLENLYEKMLGKVESLARQVEMSNAKVLELENHNSKLRHKVARAGLE